MHHTLLAMHASIHNYQTAYYRNQLLGPCVLSEVQLELVVPGLYFRECRHSVLVDSRHIDKVMQLSLLYQEVNDQYP